MPRERLVLANGGEQVALHDLLLNEAGDPNSTVTLERLDGRLIATVETINAGEASFELANGDVTELRQYPGPWQTTYDVLRHNDVDHDERYYGYTFVRVVGGQTPQDAVREAIKRTLAENMILGTESRLTREELLNGSYIAVDADAETLVEIRDGEARSSEPASVKVI